MKKLTIIASYYDQPQMFREWQRNLMCWGADTRARVRLIFSDDASPRFPLNEYFHPDLSERFDLKVFRILDDIPWNDMGSRNLCMHHAEGWCAMFDLDYLICEEELWKLLNYDTERGSEYHLRARDVRNKKPLITPQNLAVLHRDDFWKAGGYCEEFAGGYGYSDALLFRMFKRMHKGKDVVFDDIWMDHYPLEKKHGVRSQFVDEKYHEVPKIHDQSVQWLDRSLTRNQPIWLTLSRMLDKQGPKPLLRRNEKTRLKFRWEQIR